MLTERYKSVKISLRFLILIKSALRSRNFGIWNSKTLLLNLRATSTELETWLWELNHLERETHLILKTVLERLTGRSKTRCLINLLWKFGESSMETEIQELLSSFHQLWRSVWGSLVMRVVHQLHSQSEVFNQMHGKESYRANWIAMCRQLCLFFQGRRVNVLCTMMLRDFS